LVRRYTSICTEENVLIIALKTLDSRIANFGLQDGIEISRLA